METYNPILERDTLENVAWDRHGSSQPPRARPHVLVGRHAELLVLQPDERPTRL